MKHMLNLLLFCSLTLNIYFDWHRPNSLLKQVFIAEQLSGNTAQNDTSTAPQDVTAYSSAPSHTPTAHVVMEQAFAAGQLFTAFEQWQTLPLESRSAQTIHTWVNTLHNTLDTASSNTLADYLLFVQKYLAVVPDDLIALQFEAAVFLARGERIEAIYRYIQLSRQFPEHPHLVSTLVTLINTELEELTAHNHWHELIDRGQVWLGELPDNLTLVARIAHAHLALENNLEAELLLTQLTPQQQRHQLIAPLLEILNSKYQQIEIIPLTRRGEHYMLQAKIAGQHIELMIDTGASITALTAAQFDLLAYDVNFLTARRVSTANGIVEIPFYQSPGIQIGSKQQTPFEFGVMTTSGQGPGLLGMNFLRHFKFEIDQQNAQLILKPRE
ncbi:retroviral-like aspartic protease family protein [Pseudoalteromonas sp. SMS1]|uniref:retropepsin-like aspartic protease family protein n=1 Tax=Pseudoalteromonas sp. SMS1 TaxID=2908894 RepID=UPI001F16FC11|nr:retropepsin-like aspartic protease [Pseudoalteromonas sp. SMS1]MCF2858560.1 retroviral-like aspartic protease family protein [Pseudoalteromonas sp. SMS1]